MWILTRLPVLFLMICKPRGFGWRIHCGVEVTISSTNKQPTHSRGSRLSYRLGPATPTSDQSTCPKCGARQLVPRAVVNSLMRSLRGGQSATA